MAYFSHLYIQNWFKKLVSLGFAVLIWFLVGQSITVTRTLTNIPVRIVDLEPEQTVLGLQKNGLLNKKVSLTITGHKSTIQELRSSNLEVVISAAGHSEGWIAKINKHNLVCSEQSNISKGILHIATNDLFIQLTQYVTEDVTLIITPPIGSPPKGYEYLDVWPKILHQKVSGPKEYVQALKEQDLELTFNLNKVSFEELERNRIAQGNHDEIIFPVPEEWKKILIPFENAYVNLNDPQADFLRLLFLKQNFVPLDLNLPIFLFFPVKYLSTVNPQVYTLDPKDPIVLNQGIFQVNIPLYVKEVSRLFLDVVKNNLAITITMTPNSVLSPLGWAIEFMDEKTLEDTFLKETIAQEYGILHDLALIDEVSIRHRFREYLRKLSLFTKDGSPLNLSAEIQDNKVIIQAKSTETTKVYKKE